jgi:hypothetical protein
MGHRKLTEQLNNNSLHTLANTTSTIQIKRVCASHAESTDLQAIGKNRRSESHHPKRSCPIVSSWLAGAGSSVMMFNFLTYENE